MGSIVVTGGAGFIGSNFIRYRLETTRDKIAVLDRDDPMQPGGRLADIPEYRDRVTCVKAEIGLEADNQEISRAMKDVDCIVHFAAEPNEAAYNENNVTDNARNTRILLEAAAENNVRRFHQISTGLVFPPADYNTGTTINELAGYRDLHGTNLYVKSKVAADREMLWQLMPKITMDQNEEEALRTMKKWQEARGRGEYPKITLSYFPNIYGPQQTVGKRPPLIPAIITKLLKGDPITMFRDPQSRNENGFPIREWLFVEDAVRAINTILDKSEPFEAYIIGGESFSIQTVARSLEKIFLKIAGETDGTQRITVSESDLPTAEARYAFDDRKLQALGWERISPFETALEQTMRWYMANTEEGNIWREEQKQREGRIEIPLSHRL